MGVGILTWEVGVTGVTWCEVESSGVSDVQS